MKFYDSQGIERELIDFPDSELGPRWLGCKLGGIRRFQGDPRALTVLQHSILCAQIALKAGLGECVAGWCLTHDLAEALLGDAHGPTKTEAQREAERQVEAVLIMRGWRLPPIGSKLVKTVDDCAFKIERQMMWPKVYGRTHWTIKHGWLDMVQELEVYHGNAT